MESSWLRCAAEVGRCVEADRRGRFRSLNGKRAVKRVQGTMGGACLKGGDRCIREPTAIVLGSRCFTGKNGDNVELG